MTEPFADLPRGHFKAILADPPWHFQAWAGARKSGAGVPCRATERHYDTMKDGDICGLPVAELAAPDCVLFLWTCWPMLERTFPILDAWGFTYKTCAFSWIKADVRQIDLFRDDATADMMLGYWTRANSEVCLLATRGKPKRLNADVRQGIIEKGRQHSRKPDCVHGRIERLVAGPYLELFARAPREGWTVWGNETDKFEAAA
jgi:N6-adenosine-specific RNA methylase IME4